MNEDQLAFLHLCQQKETTVDDLKRFCSKNERHFFSSLLNNRPVFHTWLIACCEKSAWSLMFFIFEKDFISLSNIFVSRDWSNSMRLLNLR